MKTTLIAGFLVLGATAFAASNTHKVQILQDSVIEGKAIKAGDYKVSMMNGNAVLKHGKDAIEVPAHEVTATDKPESTEVTYDQNNIKEIAFGGSHTKIVFDGTGGGAQSGM
jgi:cell division septation protein DedD